jgi:toxin-antitoxin system PIN domain toxin
MIAVDTNILIYAHRAETSLHEQSSALLRELAEGDAVWALPIFCLAEFVRVVTHLRVFDPPTELGVALDFLDRLLEAPTIRLLLPTAGYPASFREACESAAARGNLAFDAQIAAVCREHGVSELVTADRDFARFPALKARVLRA